MPDSNVPTALLLEDRTSVLDFDERQTGLGLNDPQSNPGFDERQTALGLFDRTTRLELDE